MKELHPYSPEERRKRLAQAAGRASARRRSSAAKREIKPLIVAKRVAIGVYDDGFIHAGNLAYLALLALFPFFILAAARRPAARRGPRTRSWPSSTILGRLPPEVARRARRRRSTRCSQGRSGALLWFGAIVGLWTAASFIETIRDILRRAYGVKYSASFWQYRLASMAIILGVGRAADAAPSASPSLLASAHHFVVAELPFSEGAGDHARLLPASCPALTLFVTFYIIFLALTPARYRKHRMPQMARRVARHRLVAGDGRAAARRRSACSAAMS